MKTQNMSKYKRRVKILTGLVILKIISAFLTKKVKKIPTIFKKIQSKDVVGNLRRNKT